MSAGPNLLAWAKIIDGLTAEEILLRVNELFAAHAAAILADEEERKRRDEAEIIAELTGNACQFSSSPVSSEPPSE